jgi:hypothetical protein
LKTDESSQEIRSINSAAIDARCGVIPLGTLNIGGSV